MKKLIFLALTLAVICATSTSLAAAEPQVTGEYSGSWSSNDGSTGNIDIALVDSVADSWSAEVKLWADGDSIPVTMKSVAIDGSKVEIVFDFRAEGQTSTVKLKGAVTSKFLVGGYEVLNRKGRVSSSGTWTSKRSG
ncbi:MAG: hypothetical protein ACKVI3_10125 [Verrucomicrobiia bacterium]